MTNFKLSANTIVDKNNKIQNFPVGTIVPFFGSSSIPDGWLLCDGSAYSTTGTYKDLYDVIGTTYGSGTGTFLLPNMADFYVASSNVDNVTNYPLNHTHSGNISNVSTDTTHTITHTHTGGATSMNAASASHNHNAAGNSVNGGITPGSNANSVANRAVNPGPTNTSPQAGWVGHTHNAGSGTTNVGNDPYNHNHNTNSIGSSFNASGTAAAHTISNNTFNFSTVAVTPLAVRSYFIIKY